MSVDQDINSKPAHFEKFDEDGGTKRNLQGWNLKLVAIVAISWSLFQLWYASPLPYILNFGKIIDVPARSLHLAFGLVLCFLVYPTQLFHYDMLQSHPLSLHAFLHFLALNF